MYTKELSVQEKRQRLGEYGQAKEESGGKIFQFVNLC